MKEPASSFQCALPCRMSIGHGIHPKFRNEAMAKYAYLTDGYKHWVILRYKGTQFSRILENNLLLSKEGITCIIWLIILRWESCSNCWVSNKDNNCICIHKCQIQMDIRLMSKRIFHDSFSLEDKIHIVLLKVRKRNLCS